MMFLIQALDDADLSMILMMFNDDVPDSGSGRFAPRRDAVDFYAGGVIAGGQG